MLTIAVMAAREETNAFKTPIFETLKGCQEVGIQLGSVAVSASIDCAAKSTFIYPLSSTELRLIAALLSFNIAATEARLAEASNPFVAPACHRVIWAGAITKTLRVLERAKS